MSNPAVIKLQRKKIANQSMWMDDNFGEAIHIHLGDIRVDLTNVEFEQLCNDLCEAINRLVDVENFDCHLISPVFFEMMLWKDLAHLKSVEIENIKLEDLRASTDKRVSSLKEARGVKALQGDAKENNKTRPSHLIGQSSEERLNGILKSIEENGYPYKGQYIIVYNDNNLIRDGQHRASCLYHLYGNIEVPVMRLKFDNAEEMEKALRWNYKGLAIIGYKIKKNMQRLKHPKVMLKNVFSIIKKIKKKWAKIKQKIYTSLHSTEIRAMESVCADKYL